MGYVESGLQRELEGMVFRGSHARAWRKVSSLYDQESKQTETQWTARYANMLKKKNSQNVHV